MYYDLLKKGPPFLCFPPEKSQVWIFCFNFAIQQRAVYRYIKYRVSYIYMVKTARRRDNKRKVGWNCESWSSALLSLGRGRWLEIHGKCEISSSRRCDCGSRQATEIVYVLNWGSSPNQLNLSIHGCFLLFSLFSSVHVSCSRCWWCCSFTTTTTMCCYSQQY